MSFQAEFENVSWWLLALFDEVVQERVELIKKFCKQIQIQKAQRFLDFQGCEMKLFLFQSCGH